MSSSTASPASGSSEVTNQADLIRDEILKASLPFITEHGFTLSALTEGLSALRSSTPASTSSSITSFLTNEPSPLFLEHIFPSAPPKIKHTLSSIKHLNRRNIFKSAEMPFPMNGMGEVEQAANEEQTGPRRALFEAWLENALKELQQSTVNTQETKGPPAERKQAVLELLQKRLELNVPVLHHLPSALGTLARLEPTQPSVSTFGPYLSHVGSIAKQIKRISGSNISTPRLATVYSLSEFYQLSKTNPDIVTVLSYTNDLLKSTEKYDGLIKESVGFVGYAIKSWGNIMHSRGL